MRTEIQGDADSPNERDAGMVLGSGTDQCKPTGAWSFLAIQGQTHHFYLRVLPSSLCEDRISCRVQGSVEPMREGSASQTSSLLQRDPTPARVFWPFDHSNTDAVLQDHWVQPHLIMERSEAQRDGMACAGSPRRTGPRTQASWDSHSGNTLMTKITGV